MNEIFEDYLGYVWGEAKQATFKFKQFTYNYRRYLPRSKKVSLLDVGPGRGEMLSMMKRWGYRDALGVDISPTIVKFCRSLGLNCLEVKDTISWLRHHKGKFAFISALDVVEHFPKEQVIPLLKALRLALAPGGSLLIQIPNMQSVNSNIPRYDDFTHEVGFTEASLGQVLRAAGFKKFFVNGFEELVLGGFKEKIVKILRSINWRQVRLFRVINGDANCQILHHVFYAVAKRED